ncbi:MAG TPA: radical SAM protein [Bryobacteraceae bacterium]|nr:radical SAM protein [Bryobacteraceae bacterium]
MPELIGIARLAAESPLVEAKRRVEYFELPTRSYITYCASPRVPFRWTINPYRGCEFGCKYCYARYAHEFMELRDPLQFERKIFAKQFDAARFRDELHKIPRGETIAIGTATDPYQPAERRYRVTRAILEVFASTSGFHLGVTTKSDLIARDIDLLSEIARRHYLGIHMTVTTVDRELARLIEPMAPRPDLRIAAVRKLNAAGIRANIFASPVMPLINDSDPSLDAVAKSAARAGARSFGGQVLFLKPCSRAVFLPFLEEHFPLLVRRYKERFERVAYLRGDYPEKIQERIRQIRRRYGFDVKTAPAEPELWLQDAQLMLFS